MRCFLIAVSVVVVVFAVRVDEDPAPADAEEEQPDELTDEERGEVLRAQAVHDSAVIGAHRAADTHQAVVAAANAIRSTGRIADQAKDYALQRAGRHAVRLDKHLEAQTEATSHAVKATMRRDRLIKRAGATASYKAKADQQYEAMDQNQKEKVEMEELEMESAVGAAHKEKVAEDAWKAADEAASVALKAKQDAEAKWEEDVETAEKAAHESQLADKEAAKKAAAAKALALRSEDKTAQFEEADKKKKDAYRVQREANANARDSKETADKSEKQANKATKDREAAAKAAEAALATEKKAKASCKLESTVAGQVLDDATAANEVHAEEVVKNNDAGLAAEKAKIVTKYRAASAKSANAVQVAQKAVEVADAVTTIESAA